MGIWDGLAHATAQALAASLSEDQRQRGTALIVSRAAKSDGAASDLVALADYVITGHTEPHSDTYPRSSGDVTVLGPEIFASTPDPQDGTTINWQGMNFTRQVNQVDEGYHVEIGGHRFTESQWLTIQDYCAGTSAPTEPDPQGESGEPDPAEPAPMAGAHWRGRRGNQTG